MASDDAKRRHGGRQCLVLSHRRPVQRTGATAVAGTVSKRSWAFQGGPPPKSSGTGQAATSAQRAANANVMAGTKRCDVPTADGPNADAPGGGAASTASAEFSTAYANAASA